MEKIRIAGRRLIVVGIVLAVLLLTVIPRAFALDPDRRISQYAHTAWRTRDGAFAGTPSAITQTTDGYIWIGTVAGLVRFDGVRFVPFTPPAGQHLPNSAVFALLGAADGSLWIGTGSGLAQWKNGNLINFPETAGRVNAIYQDSDGTIWIARSRTNAGGVCKVAASVADCYAPKDGVPPHAATLIKDGLGYFLIGTDTGLVRWKPGSSTSYELPELKSQPGLSGISSLALALDGSIWVGIYHVGHGLGLQKWVNNSWKTLITPTFNSSAVRVSGLQLDRSNALWVATEQTGLYRIHDGGVDHFGAADGLSSDSVEYAFEDRESNLWVATAEGVDCFRSLPVVNFSMREGLSGANAGSILATHDGTVWIGNHRRLDFVRGNVVSSVRKSELLGNIVTSLFEDHAGRIWVGVDNGLFIYEHNRFTPIRGPDSNPMGIVLSLAEDTENNVWASLIRTPPGRPTKLICFRDGKFVKEISDLRLDVVSVTADPQSGLWLGLRQGGVARYRNDHAQVFPFKDAKNIANQISANSDGSILVATNHGLVEQREDSQHTLDDKNGLPCNRIYALITDKRSNLWLYAECGLIRIKSDEIERWRENPDLQVRFDLFDAYDGAQPYLPPFRPVATRSPDGRLWFANEVVAQMIDPDGQLRNSMPPPVHIEEVIAGRKIYSAQSGIRLPALTRDLEIDYTALSFVVPQKVKFRYKLEGYDRDWQDAGTRRQAFYSNLAPRNYTFRVKASNNSGVWNEAGASLDFLVAPAYYQTSWFLLSCVAVFVALLYALHRWRVHRLKNQEQRLWEVVETIPAMTFTASSDGSCTFVNKRWIEYTGLSIEETSGTGWQRAVHPEDLADVSEKWQISVLTGKPFEAEARFRRSDGEYRWFLVRGVPLRDLHGKIVKWYGTLTDIEDRKRTEEALQLMSDDLQDSKAKLEEAQRIAQVGYWVWDLETNRLTWPDETYRIFGLQPQERAIDLHAFHEMVHPEDREFVLRAADDALRGKVHREMEHRIVRPNGEVRVVHSQADVEKDASGRPTHLFGTVQDITDRKRAEEALRRSQFYLSEGQRLAHMGSWAFNPSGFFDYWSDELFQIYGLDPHKGAPTLEQYLATIHPEDRESMAETIKTMHLQRGGCDVRKRIVRPDGKLRYVRCVGIPVIEEEELKGFLGTAIDVTEQAQLEQEREQLHQLEAELAHTNRVSMLGELAASLAHEIKQPIAAAITSANSCIEWLTHEPPNLDRARAAARRIDTYGNRAAEIIDRLRSFYRKSPPHRELINVNGIIHEILTLLQGEATRSSVIMRTDLAAGLPEIMADRVQLQQVFMNLMLNAIEAMRDSGGDLTVSSKQQNDQLLFSISDTGMGLPTENADQIFSAFFTTKPQGSGMGLAISRSILESHGGRLWASANDGRGATFQFNLPIEVP